MNINAKKINTITLQIARLERKIEEIDKSIIPLQLKKRRILRCKIEIREAKKKLENLLKE